MHLDYLILRTIRHYLPASAVRGLLRRGLIIRPGLETADPQAAVTRYLSSLEAYGHSVLDQRVLVFGYGGRFGVACGLLANGAAHVVLCDRFAPPDETHNKALLPEYDRFLKLDGGLVRPRAEFISLLHADIRDPQESQTLKPQNLVLSSSVYEHLDDAEGVTGSLKALTAPGGAHLHFIDLRDHYFKYPFEMLCYDENTWRRRLNPGSNLNRLRYRDYQEIFERNFRQVDLTILTSDPEAFESARSRIRQEFLTGDLRIDTAATLQVFATA